MSSTAAQSSGQLLHDTDGQSGFDHNLLCHFISPLKGRLLKRTVSTRRHSAKGFFVDLATSTLLYSQEVVEYPLGEFPLSVPAQAVEYRERVLAHLIKEVRGAGHETCGPRSMADNGAGDACLHLALLSLGCFYQNPYDSQAKATQRHVTS